MLRSMHYFFERPLMWRTKGFLEKASKTWIRFWEKNVAGYIVYLVFSRSTSWIRNFQHCRFTRLNICRFCQIKHCSVFVCAMLRPIWPWTYGNLTEYMFVSKLFHYMLKLSEPRVCKLCSSRLKCNSRDTGTQKSILLFALFSFVYASFVRCRGS